MANPLKWLEELDALQSVEAIKGYLDKGVDAAGGEGTWGGAIAKGLLTPAYAPVEGVSAIGGLIGGAAGAIGGGLSEAGQESKSNSELLDSLLQGSKGGAEAGAKAARENITALDLASMGAGTLASGALKGAKAASVVGSLDDAVDLAKSASKLSKLDLGLSAVDAGVGGSQIVSGVEERDPLKAIMGVARVAGNAYGGVNAMKDASLAKGFGVAADEVASIVDDVPTKSLSKGKIHRISTLTDSEGGEVPLYVKGSGLGDTLDQQNAKELMAISNSPERSDSYSKMGALARKISESLKLDGAYDRLNDLIEHRFSREFVEGRVDLDIKGRSRTPWFVEALQRDPNDPVALKDRDAFRKRTADRSGEFGGLFHGSESKGFTGASDANTVTRDPVVGNRYWINPREVGTLVRRQIDFLTNVDGNVISPEKLEQATHAMGPTISNLVRGIREGTIPFDRAAERTLEIELFKRNLLYTIVHEDLGHAFWDSEHIAAKNQIPGIPGKNPAYYDNIVPDAIIDGPNYMPTSMNPKTIGTPGEEFDMFSVFQNQIFNEMNDPTKLSKLKAMLDSPEMGEQLGKMFDATQPLKPEELLAPKKTPHMKQGRTVGTAELAEAKREFAADEVPADDAVKMAMTAEETDAIDLKNAKIQKEIGRKTKAGETSGNETVWEQPTPQPEAPRFGKPLPPDDPMGENLRPLANRIKEAFKEQNRINVLNDMKNREFRHEKMLIEEDAWNKYNSGQISNEELFRRLEEARKGSHQLLTESLGMRLAPGEFEQVLDIVKQQAVKNTEERNNLALSWRKMANGERLTEGEVKNLRESLKAAIGDEKKNPIWLKILAAGENLIGGSRALMSSMDLSAAGRQALYASVTNPRETARAFKAQIDALKMTKTEFEKYMKTLTDPKFNPFAELSEASGLHITGPHEIAEKVEEAFINPTWAEKIPGVRRTEQAYIAYLNKMRVELFNKGADNLMDAGVPHFNDDGTLSQAYKDLAYMVNTLTGRGEMSLMHISPTSRMGKKMGLQTDLNPGETTMNQMHRGLTSVFFAPRFTASRAAILRDSTMALLGGNLDPKVHKMYMKNVYGTYAAQMAVVSMLVGTGVATFQADPRKQDFGNLKVGNVRYDIFGGIKQWAKLFTVLGTDKYFSKAYGLREYGEGMGAKTKTGEVGKFLQGKLSPPAGFVLEALTGEDYLGRKSNLLKNAYGHMIPMIIQTAQEVIEAGEADQLAIAVPAAGLGIGVNAYKPQVGGSWKR